MSLIGQRIKQLREKKNLTQKDISDALGVKPQTVSSWERLDRLPGDTILIGKLAELLKVSVDYIVGNSDIPLPSDATIKPITNFKNVPLVTVKAMAGYTTGFGDDEFIASLPTVPVVVDRNYAGRYVCFECEGDSMDDGSRKSICDRDVVLARSVPRDLWRGKLHLNDWYFVIVHRDGVVIKQITKHDTETGFITCHSLNPLYEDFLINLDDVKELFNVVKLVDRSVRL